VLGAEELLSVIHCDNRRSMRVAERIGHRRLPGELEVRGFPCVLYGQRRRDQSTSSSFSRMA
jgi:RimJ/RimL family protein N-acetyltransferase